MEVSPTQLLLVGLILMQGVVHAQRTTNITDTCKAHTTACLENLETLKAELRVQATINNELEERIRALEQAGGLQVSECQNDRPPCRTSCPTGWEYHSHDGTSKSCYLFNTTKTSWHVAAGQCIHSSNNTATLVKIDSMNENSYLIARLREQFWIGLHYDSTKSQWQWYNGETLGFTFWRQGQPAAEPSIYRCAFGNFYGHWYPFLCTTKKSFICEMPLQAECT
ncbi:unnamed protein product [Owenia fusiformis]|uniref:Uncharacterized protein n=1 Tax=Owenia fusiformis TaxID=6347 RepID=A0A8J1U1Z6_OWEFU|nr:unnamed protein product [Owenia fusiformis]